MSDMKCPRCQTPLDGSYVVDKVYGCPKCRSIGSIDLWNSLDIAVDALKYANKCIKGGCVSWETEIDKALKQITALEQKEHFAGVSKMIEQKDK